MVVIEEVVNDMIVENINESVIIKREFDHSIELADNSIIKLKPELFNEWDFDKNDKLGLNVYTASRGSDKRAWWICPKCKSSYENRISNRFNEKKCSYCAGSKVNHTNALASLEPVIMKEWHPFKNTLNPNEITSVSVKKAWWLGKCGHEWNCVIRSRTVFKTGCPYCIHNPQVFKGVTDMWTTNPELAKLLADPEDGYKHTQGSNAKLDWKCPDCQSIIEERIVYYIKKNMRIPCKNCSDGFSFSEKFIYHLLKENNIKFQGEKAFKWSGKKRYDFYLTEYNWVVETHGIQHYEEVTFHSKNKRGIAYQIENDQIKKELAKINGIENYIILDCRESTSEFIIESIFKSDLKSIIDIKNIAEIERRASSSFLISSCEMWNKGMSVREISEELGVWETTVRAYLHKGRKINLCSYSSEKSIIRTKQKPTKQSKKVVQLTPDFIFVKEWNSLTEIQKTAGYSADYISKCCRGIGNKIVLKHRWLFAEEYYKEENDIIVHG